MEQSLAIIDVNAENLAEEGICCGFSDKKHQEGVQSKQEWLMARFAEGMKYKKLNVRGKVFIEYIPAEYAWSPIDAPGYMFIHCFWVSGRYKGQGWGKQLLEECFQDARGNNGVAVVTTRKNTPFTTEKKFFVKHGFEVCDSAPPYFELLVKRFKEDAAFPAFRETAKRGECENKNGFTFIYSDQCPYTNHWVEQMIEFAAKRGIPGQKIRITNREEAQKMPTPFPLFSMLYNGKFVTQEMMPEKKFNKLIDQLLS